MEARVLGLGNALVDILVRIPSDDILKQFDLPRGGMQLVGEERSAEIFEAIKGFNPTIVPGGSASNTICGLASLGVTTGLIGKICPDELGGRYHDELVKSGVEAHLLQSRTHTGSCISLISPDSERTMVTCLGAAVELETSDLDPETFKRFSHFYAEGYLVQNHELIEQALKMAHEQGLRVMIDLASYNVVEDNLEFLRRLIRKYVDVIFANEEEATAFTGKEDTEALAEMGELADEVILKQGSRGSIVKKGGETVRVGTTKSNCIDTTGAGDLYAAGYIAAQLGGMSTKQCAAAGAITAGNVIEIIGTKMDNQRWTKIRQEIKKL